MGIKAAVMLPHPPLIVPEIGRGEEREIQKTIDAYTEAARRIRAYEPETIVLFSPHQTMYADYFHISPGSGARGDFGRFRASQVQMEVSYDTGLVKELCRLAEARDIPAGTLGEKDARLDHGTMVPLYFVNQFLQDYKLVRIGLSGLPLTIHYELGQCIREAVESLGRNVVLIASGDLSHCLKEDGPYGYHEEGPEYDRRIMEVMEKADFGELFHFSESFLEAAGECGHRSFMIMAGALDRMAVRAERLSYEGPFGVGYGICTYEVQGEDQKRNFGGQFAQILQEKLAKQRAGEDAYVRLARRTIEEYVCTGRKPEMHGNFVKNFLAELPEETVAELQKGQAGVFVSLHKGDALRGCIGTIQAVRDSIAEEIIENAVSAATRDPRFTPVQENELDMLSISVDVLGETEKIASPEELDVKRYGVIVSKGMRRGLLLPNLDGVDTVEEQIAIAKQKAGIREEEAVELERFEVVRHY